MKFRAERVIVILFLLVTAEGSFCSSYCKDSNCNGDGVNQCKNRCNTNWQLDGNNCIPQATYGWAAYDTTDDLTGGTLSVSGQTGASTCTGLTYYQMGMDNTATITTPVAGITNAFFQMSVTVTIIAVDPWSNWDRSNAYFYLTFVEENIQTISSKVSSPYKKEKYCYENKPIQYAFQIKQTYTYNTTNTQLSWTLHQAGAANTTGIWGFKEFLIIARYCHWACTGCYGEDVDQCYTCLDNGTFTMYKSGSTCNQSCLAGYGQVTSSLICVQCDAVCSACHETSSNCSACTTSGSNQAYLYIDPLFPSDGSCMTTCPTGYFANTTTNLCDQCATNCTACIGSSTYCTACEAGFGWTGYGCYDPCPDAYYMEASGTNCTACSLYCSACETNSTTCSVCTINGTYNSYLLNDSGLTGTCESECPTGYYPQDYSGAGPNVCLACDPACVQCTGNPSPCSLCQANYYLFNDTNCTNPCPSDTFASNASGIGKCHYCQIDCCDLTIEMYFKNSLKQKVICDIVFTQQLDYSTFDMQSFQTFSISSDSGIEYTTDMFTYTYSNLSTKVYRITIVPKGYIFLYNATITVTTQAEPSPVHYSAEGFPFKSSVYEKSASINWFLINGPPYTELEEGIITSFASLSEEINQITTAPYLQEIKKTGILMLLAPGAQTTSLTMLSNQIHAQNHYEGVRLFSTGLYFQAPDYEDNPKRDKRFFHPTVQDQIRNAQEVDSEYQRRVLFSTDSLDWRFQRVGFTSFFIYDVYIPMMMLGLCWLGMLIGYKCKQAKWYRKYAANFYSLVHKVHQLSIFYVTMCSIIEYTYFQPTSSQRFISAILCGLFNLYFIIYHLYIYYDMLRYPLAEVGNQWFDYYSRYYGSFLKNVRHQEYDMKQPWSTKHWFRPYNYHLLSYYKKFIFIIAMPLLYQQAYAQIGVLVLVQILQLVRFITTWPYLSPTRNRIRLSFELALLVFFLISLVEIPIISKIMKSDSESIGNVISAFNALGWVGFGCCCYYNLGFIAVGVYDFCLGLRVSNAKKMEKARQSYYEQKIEEYQRGNEASSRDLVNRWVKLGNLNHNHYGELPQINVRIEQLAITPQSGSTELAVEVRKITRLTMKKKKNYRRDNNTTAGHKLERTIKITPLRGKALYDKLQPVFKAYSAAQTESVILKTFLNVEQGEFEGGDEIPFYRSSMFQRVEVVGFNGESESVEVDELIEGFPLNEEDIPTQ